MSFVNRALAHRLHLALVFVLLLLPGCKKPDEAEAEEGPGRAVMVEQLVALARLVEARDEAGVRARLVAPPDMPEPHVLELVRSLLQDGGVTVAGAQALASEGNYGALGRIFRLKGPDQARALKLDPDQCFAIKHRDTEVIGHWDGSQFRFFRLDNIGKAARP